MAQTPSNAKITQKLLERSQIAKLQLYPAAYHADSLKWVQYWFLVKEAIKKATHQLCNKPQLIWCHGPQVPIGKTRKLSYTLYTGEHPSPASIFRFTNLAQI